MLQMFTPSVQQKDFFDWIEGGNGSCVLEAVAGAGKTTTLIQALNLMTGYIFFGAYNKKIAEEIQARAPALPNLTISTMHAAGFRFWRKVAKNVRVDGDKCKNIFREITFRNMSYGMLESPVLELVSYAKQAAVGVNLTHGVSKQINDTNVWLDLINHFDVETFDQRTEQDNTIDIIRLAQEVFVESTKRDTSTVDFDDMIFAPLFHNVRIFGHDWVLIDEAQDTNASRRELSLRMLKKNGRLVAVGDRHQAIYGFTGADADALDLIAAATNAARLPLTTTFRCPKAVVQYAQQWVSHIHAHETALDGMVKQLDDGVDLTTVVGTGDAILCRFNAPLITRVYEFIAKGIPARVEGRDIGNGLKALARRWKVKSVTALRDKLDAFAEREVEKFKQKEQQAKADALIDKIRCLHVIISRVPQSELDVVSAVIAEIDKIFGAEGNSPVVLLSSIHKSKGREWKNVFWMQTPPSPYARQPWELDQETNLNYVAATRAQVNLFTIQVKK